MEKDKANKVTVRIESGFLIVEKGGKIFRFEVKKISERLANAFEEQLNQFTVSPSGDGIHWNLIDEDISIPALLNEPLEPYGNKGTDAGI